MAYQRLEVLTGTERRRKWLDTDKVRLVEAAFTPGMVVKEVARRFGGHESLLYRWPRQLGASVLTVDGPFPAFSPVQLALVDKPMAVPIVETAKPAPNPPTASVAEISVLLPGEIEVRLRGSVEPALATAVIRAAGGAG